MEARYLYERHYTAKRKYSRSNSIKSPTSSAYNVSQPRVMSQIWRVREIEYAWICVCLHLERWRCQYSSAYVVAAIMWLRELDLTVCGARAEVRDAKWQGLCGYNPPIQPSSSLTLKLYLGLKNCLLILRKYIRPTIVVWKSLID